MVQLNNSSRAAVLNINYLLLGQKDISHYKKEVHIGALNVSFLMLYSMLHTYSTKEFIQ